MIFNSMTLRNFRSFGPEGANIPLDLDFVGIVGVNNSGKTSLLRALWELRPVLQELANIEYRPQDIGRALDDGGGPAPLVTQINSLPGERLAPLASSPGDLRFTLSVNDTAQREVGIKTLTVVRSHVSSSTRLLFEFADGTQSTDCQVQMAGGEPPNVFIDFQLPTGEVRHIPFSAIADGLRLLTHSQFIGAFRNFLNQGGGTYYDLTLGQGFITTFDDFKNGTDANANESIRALLRELRDIFGLTSLDVSASPAKDHLVISVDDRSYRASELGSGLAQFVILGANVLVRRPHILLLDEPELNLHASLQARFLAMLARYVQGPIIFSTHSLGLARSAADRVLVSRVDGSRNCHLEEYRAASSLALTLGELGYGGLNDAAYRAILLVEGVSDVRVYQELLIKKGIWKDVVILPLGGDDMARGGRSAELEEICRLSEHVYAVVDSETEDPAMGPSKRRAEFRADCQRLGVECLISERRSIENYLDQKIARQLMPGLPQDDFGHYDRLPAQWSKSANWRIARDMTAEQLRGLDIWEFIERIAQELDADRKA